MSRTGRKKYDDVRRALNLPGVVGSSRNGNRLQTSGNLPLTERYVIEIRENVLRALVGGREQKYYSSTGNVNRHGTGGRCTYKLLKLIVRVARGI